MAASRLAVDQIVGMREEGGCIAIEPIRESGLEMLVAGITSANMHGEVSFGLAVGKGGLVEAPDSMCLTRDFEAVDNPVWTRDSVPPLSA